MVEHIEECCQVHRMLLNGSNFSRVDRSVTQMGLPTILTILITAISITVAGKSTID